VKPQIDNGKLERLAGVKFGASDIDWLERFTANYAEHFNEPPPPDYLLGHKRDDRLTPRRAFIWAVEDLWRQRWRRNEHGWHYNRHKGHYDGPLLRLLLYLFEAAGGKVPSAATIVGDLKELTQLPPRPARKRSGKRKSAAT
jgi:hypothetical protein